MWNYFWKYWAKNLELLKYSLPLQCITKLIHQIETTKTTIYYDYNKQVNIRIYIGKARVI